MNKFALTALTFCLLPLLIFTTHPAVKAQQQPELFTYDELLQLYETPTLP